VNRSLVAGHDRRRVWIGMHIQVGPHGVGYVGTQAAFAFIVT
jgi:hypothetical protein